MKKKSAQAIRKEMEETKARLSQKFELLEKQFSDPFQSVGAAAYATTEAARRTLESVSGTVRHAVTSANLPVDVRAQIQKHPWLVLTGATMFGYFAAGFFQRRKTSRDSRVDSSSIRLQANSDQLAAIATPQNQLVPATYPRHESPFWDQTKAIATRTIGKLIEESISRALPRVLDNLTGVQSGPHSDSRDVAHEIQSSPDATSPTREQKELVATNEGDLFEKLFHYQTRGEHPKLE